MAEHQTFVPRALTDQIDWLEHFSLRLPTYATKYGISAAEQADLAAGVANVKYWRSYDDAITLHARKAVSFRQELMNGVAAGATGATAPVLPTFGAAPATAAQPDVLGRAASIAGRIKKHKDYVKSDGADMGLEGADVQGQPGPVAPQLKLSIGDGGRVHVGWKKGSMDGIEIQKSTDGDSFAFLAIDTKPDYIDTDALPAPGQSGVWYYRAIYRKGDAQAGQWSDAVSIAVKG